LSCIGWSYEA